MDIFKATPEQVGKYIDFLMKFSQSPRQALDPFVTNDSKADPKVSPHLLCYMAVSVGLALLLTLIGTAVGMAPDSSRILTVVGRIDGKVLPFAAVALVVIVAVVWHGLANALGWLLSWVSYTPPFKGQVAGSINALLAFTAWFLPLYTIVLVGFRVAALQVVGMPMVLFLATVVPLSFLFPVYFVLAFAAAHRLSAGHAFTLFSFSVVGLLFLSDVFG